jgi:hypothetical protein
MDMPADTDTDDNTPTQSDKIGWRRGLQQTDSHRLNADQLREIESDAGVTPACADDQRDEDVSDRAAIFEASASRYYSRRTEVMSPKGADRRGEAARILDAATIFLEALDNASDTTLNSLNDLGGEVGELHRAATKTLTAAAQLTGPAPAGRPSHEHLDDFVYELVTMIELYYNPNFKVDFFKVYFTDDGEPVPPASVFLWRLVKHFDPRVKEGSLRTAMRRANQKLREANSVRENPP